MTDTLPKNKIDVTEHIGLVHLCANRFKNRGIEYEELYSAGCLGLLKAKEHFNPEFSVKFSTYAVPVILGEIKRLFRDGGVVRVSRSLKELSLKITKIREDYLSKLGREPDVSELCEQAGETSERICEAINVSQPPLSLTYSNDEPSEVLIPVDAQDERITDLISLREVLSKLNDEDRTLIYLRYYRGLTQVKTAAVMGITQIQVSRREKKLLLHMRSQMCGE
ncbi:MAG: sigma-70 family RNA polymerase sigma factor [Ruminococcus sp.]|nr:sigma-70 family RNA polymerase sigma factor [Ruminococcus sp.]